MEWMTEMDRHGSNRREVKSKASGCVSFSSQHLSPWKHCVRMQLEMPLQQAWVSHGLR